MFKWQQISEEQMFKWGTNNKWINFLVFWIQNAYQLNVIWP